MTGPEKALFQREAKTHSEARKARLSEQTQAKRQTSSIQQKLDCNIDVKVSKALCICLQVFDAKLLSNLHVRDNGYCCNYCGAHTGAAEAMQDPLPSSTVQAY